MGNAVVIVEDQISEDQRLAITAPLGEFSAARGFEFRPTPICLSLREGNQMIGGLIGHTNWEWLHIEILSVAMHVRGRGVWEAAYGNRRRDRAHAELRRSLGRH